MRKLCISAEYGYHARFVERVTLAKQMGFDEVFLSMRRRGKRLALFEDICLGIELCKQHNIGIEFIHLPNIKNYNLLWEEGTNGDIFCDYLIGIIAQCAMLGCKLFVTHTGYKKELMPPVNEFGLKRFERLAKACEKFDVRLAIENTESYEHDTFILENIKSKNVGLCFDSGHQNVFYNENEKDILDRFGNRLMAVHLHDNFGEKDEHYIPRYGNIDWDILLAKLKTLPEVAITFEIKNFTLFNENHEPQVLNHESEEDAKLFLQKAVSVAKEMQEILK